MQKSSPERGAIRITMDEIRGFSMKLKQNPERVNVIKPPNRFPERGAIRITADEIRGLNMKVEQNPERVQ